MKRSLCAWLLGLLASTALLAGEDSLLTQTQADAAWGKLQVLIDAGPGLMQLTRATLSVSPGSNETLERFALTLRADGLAFLEKFPTDARRYDWLPTALDYEPDYWADPTEAARLVFEARQRGESRRPQVAIDEQSKAAWADAMPTLRAGYLNSENVSAEKKISFRLSALSSVAMRGLVTRDGVGARVVRDESTRQKRAQWQQELIEISRMEGRWEAIDYAGRDLKGVADMIYQSMAADSQEQAAWREQLKITPREALVEYAGARERLAELSQRPWELQFTALDGSEVNLSAYRGHPVIVAFWAMDCVGSRRQIPKLKALHETFGTQGLKIVGSAGHREEERGQVQEFVREQGLAWPHRLDRTAHRMDFDRFGFTWVSNVMLFDAQGKLMRTEPSPDLAEWEQLIRTEIERAAAAVTTNSGPTGKPSL